MRVLSAIADSRSVAGERRGVGGELEHQVGAELEHQVDRRGARTLVNRRARRGRDTDPEELKQLVEQAWLKDGVATGDPAGTMVVVKVPDFSVANSA